MKRVVVAEDDDDLRQMLCLVLEHGGYQVIDLEDGSELLDYIAIAKTGKAPDLILADVHMPGASGLEAVEKARAVGLQCPVIVMSANRDEAVARRALDIAQTRFIAKPSSVAQLLRLVKQAVDLRLAEGPPRVAS